MYKLNNISVINAEKIKIGKDSFNCNINSKVVVYIARMAESKKDIKIVLDEYTILKTDYGFSLSLISDAIDAVVFNKNTQLCKHLNMLETIAYTSNYAGINKKNVEKIGKNFIDVAAALEQSDMVIIYNDEAVENFVRRYIAMMKPSICEKAPVVIDRLPEKLIPYLDKLDVVEKVMIETSPANLAYQLENNMFDANISVNILPLKTLQKLTKMNVNEERIKLVANYVQSGRGTVEEVDLMLRWTVAIKKLYEKTTGYHANSGSVHAIIDVMQYGFTITEIITKVSTELMCKSDITHLEGNELLRMLAEIMEYRTVNNIQDKSMPENIVAEHELYTKLYDVEHRGIGEAYAIKAKAVNKKYANVIDDVDFMCPEHIRDYSPYSKRTTLLSVENLQLFMDGKLLIFIVGKNNGFYGGPIFAFDEKGHILMIKDTLSEQQMAAAKVLWSTIKERKES